MKTQKTPILPVIPTNIDGDLSRCLQSFRDVLQDLAMNVRADLDTVNDSIPVIPPTPSDDWSIKATTADYVILDDDDYDLVLVDSRTGAKLVTLPTLADNQGRVITVMAEYLGGAITVDGEGAETIDGIAAAVLQSKDDFVRVIGTATEWKILSCRQSMSTGWVNTNAWADKTLGNVNLVYDNLTGAFTVGEVVIEYSDSGRTTPTGKTGIIMSNSGTVLVLKNVAGGGTFTNNYYLKGATSAATADVNGATKAVETNLFHGFGRNMRDLTYHPYYSTNAAENGAYHSFATGQLSTTAEYGSVLQQIDTNNIAAQTGNVAGYISFDANGNGILWDNEDYYYNFMIQYRK
jgi:hypothetical protein